MQNVVHLNTPAYYALLDGQPIEYYEVTDMPHIQSSTVNLPLCTASSFAVKSIPPSCVNQFLLQNG